ncbi:MAG: CehA/McbA family metallohydrolase [Pirellulales bacterium]|nr:CehA/McbA family metallohydrolase [Pirellulales bacterium]
MHLLLRRPSWLVFTLATAFTLQSRPEWAAASGGQLLLEIVDRDTGKPVACRIHLVNEAGKPRKVNKLPFWHDHFACPGKVLLNLPKGAYRFTIEHGPEYVVRSGHFTIEDFADDEQHVDLQRICDMSSEGWWSGDFELHRADRELPLIVAAEDLQLLVCGDGNQSDASRQTAEPPIIERLCGRDSSGGGQLLLLRGAAFSVPVAKHEQPSSLEVIRAFRDGNPQAWVDAATISGWDLPLWLAHQAIDSVQLAPQQLGRDRMGADMPGTRPRDNQRLPGNWGAGLWSQEIYYHLLNCGFRLPPTAASGSGESSNPPGYNRVYVYLGPEFSRDAWWEALRAGRCMVTNGPLLRPLVAGQRPGHVFQAPAGGAVDLDVNLKLSTRDKIEYLEIVKNGLVERSVRLDEFAKSGELPPLSFEESGWFLIRVATQVEATYRFATTAPYYVEIGDVPHRVSRASAEFFLAWARERLARLRAIKPALPAETIALHETTVDFWTHRVDTANAP